MKSVSIADAKAHLSELIAEVDAGVEIEITRRGRPVALISKPGRALRKVDAAALRVATQSMPMQGEPVAEFIRRMRDDERY